MPAEATSVGKVYGSANWIESDNALKLAGVFICFSLMISAWHIWRHFKQYSIPQVQSCVVRILLTCPVYAILSWIALSLHNYGIYAEVVRDVYEAVVVYSFMNLILEYCGGETDCVYMMENEPRLRFPFPLCCMQPMAKTRRLLRFCQRGVVQFIITQPVAAVLNVIMLLTGVFDSTAWQAFETVVYNISYMWALYCLYVFYLAVKRNIKRFQPIAKFATVKAIVFVTYYQSLILTIFLSDASKASMWNDLLLCVEMVIFATALVFAFPVSDFQGGIPDRRVLVNAKNVFTVRDILRDVYHNFTPAYSDYALQRSQERAEREGATTPTTSSALTLTPSTLHPTQSTESGEESPSTQSVASPVPWSCRHFARDSGTFALSPIRHRYSSPPAALRRGVPALPLAQLPEPSLSAAVEKENKEERWSVGHSAGVVFNALFQRAPPPVPVKLRLSRDLDAEERAASGKLSNALTYPSRHKQQSSRGMVSEVRAVLFGACVGCDGSDPAVAVAPVAAVVALGRLKLAVRVPAPRRAPLLHHTVAKIIALRGTKRSTGPCATVGVAVHPAAATLRAGSNRAAVLVAPVRVNIPDMGAVAVVPVVVVVEDELEEAGAPEYSGQERNRRNSGLLMTHPQQGEGAEEWGAFV